VRINIRKSVVFFAALTTLLALTTATASAQSWETVAAAPNPHRDTAFTAVTADGAVHTYNSLNAGGVRYLKLREPITAIATDASGQGYWLAAADGGVFALGDAQFYGSMPLATRALNIIGIAPTQDYGGYWLLASNGHVYPFGDAYNQRLYDPLNLTGSLRAVSIVTDPVRGYSVVMSNSTVVDISTGSAIFHSPVTDAPVVSGCIDPMLSSVSAHVFFVVTRGGEIFSVGNNAPAVNSPLDRTAFPVASILCTPDGDYVWVVYRSGNAIEELVNQ
jgi:hypothetical protein